MNLDSLTFLFAAVALIALPIGWMKGTIVASLLCGVGLGLIEMLLRGSIGTSAFSLLYFLHGSLGVDPPYSWVQFLAFATVAGFGAWLPSNWSRRSAPPLAAKRSVSFIRWTSKPATSLFLSYRRSDSRDITGRVYDRLVQEFGRTSVFRDVDSIPIGIDFRQHIDGLLSKCEVCLVVIGHEWQVARDEGGNLRLLDPRDHVRIEIETALKRKIPVVPVLVGGAAIPSIRDLPESLHDLAFRNAIHVRPDPDFHRDVDRLVSGLRELKA